MTSRLFSFWKSAIAVSVFALLPFITTTTAEAGAKCHCRNSHGERIQVGNYTCIKTNEGLKEARCEYVLNNTSWKFTGKGCPFTHYQPNKDAQPYSTATIDFKKLGLKRNPLR